MICEVIDMNIIRTEKAPGAIGPYSQGYTVGGLVFTSGQIPVDPATGAVAEGIAAQADQSCRNVGLKTILAGIDHIKNGISMCIFPEGTRNKTDDLMLPFKEGSFKMAEKTGCAIVPMAITGSADILENHFPKVKATHVILEYGKPIYPNELDKETKKKIGAHCQGVIEEMLVKNEKLR